MKTKLLLVHVLVLVLIMPVACATPMPASAVPTAVPTLAYTSVPTPASPTFAPTSASTALPSATQTPAPTATPAAPPVIAGLGANNAYDGKINLWWEPSTARGFDHYNLYVSKTEIMDVTGITPTLQIKDREADHYQVTGLENGTRYYLALTAANARNNETKPVASVSAAPLSMPRGKVDPALSVVLNQSDETWASTTLLTFLTIGSERVVEINMLGEVVWQFLIPAEWAGCAGSFDAELLANNNVLVLCYQKGIFEVTRQGQVVWSYLDPKLDHDLQRLPNGNTLTVFAFGDTLNDAQVKEISPKGEIVWSWYARDYFNKPPYNQMPPDETGSWTHTNAATRLPNGNTLISLRNFDFIVEVDPKGAIVRTIGEGRLYQQHDPQVLPNGNILVATHKPLPPNNVVEIEPKTNRVVWRFGGAQWNEQLARSVHRLPNGNTMIVGATEIVEVTPAGKIVWRLKASVGPNEIVWPQDGPAKFYKAYRIGAPRK